MATQERHLSRTDQPDLMADLIRTVVRTLDEVAGLDMVWKRGIVHPGGPHYRLRGTLGPVSLGEDECRVFGSIVQEFRPANAFIIGNAFGLSSTFIAKMMESHGGRSVITLDSKSEGEGERCFNTAVAVRERLNCTLLTTKAGWSPNDIDTAAEDATYDLIFIDGDHHHPQVTRDFHGVKHLAHDETIICWHDYWMEGIPESVAEAENEGFRCIKVNTSCEMVFGTRSQAAFERIQRLFANAEPPRKRRRPGAYLKLYNALAVGAVKRYLLRVS
jgi:predicted O-methyltransferase YrrM